jgi:hypothetical protein
MYPSFLGALDYITSIIGIRDSSTSNLINSSVSKLVTDSTSSKVLFPPNNESFSI